MKIGLLFFALSVALYIASDQIEKFENRHPGEYESITNVAWGICISVSCLSGGLGAFFLNLYLGETL